MSAVVLVVDDVPANVKLLEVKLTNEYYNVITAKDGFEALTQTKQHKPDLILLDVMMPGMDGFEVCKKLKEDVEISHIPVVMVTALSDMADRVRGLEAGADDFLTKPINDIALFARVKSLIRIKVLLDELRLRDKTQVDMGVLDEGKNTFTQDVSGARIMIIDDDVVQLKRLNEKLSQQYNVTSMQVPENATNVAVHGQFDLLIISTQLSDTDGLRLAAQLKGQEELRGVPILILVDNDDTRIMTKALELGVNDYIVMPVDYNEMAARVKTQIRRKKYQDTLKSNYQQTISRSITDELTGLYNRHYLGTHLDNLVRQSLANNRPMSIMMMDMDHFKQVNDTYGHDVGDQVLKKLSELIIGTVRSADLAARYGGEEFVVLMPGANMQQAKEVAERIRKTMETTPIKINHAAGEITKTISIGVASLNEMGDSGQGLLKRADEALYKAKNTGRNQTVMAEAV